jgi:non-ribosomal peptide synthetase component E (peptide arylation enzyme)
VVGLADSLLGLRLCAVIKWRDRPMASEEISRYLRHYIASYKIPKEIFSWPHHVATQQKKPRLLLSEWAEQQALLDKDVIVGA